MTDQPADHADDDVAQEVIGDSAEDQYLSQELADKLLALGFHPGCPVYEVAPEFSVGDVERALFESSWTDPKPLQLDVPFEFGDKREEWPVSFLVESVQVVYTPYVHGRDHKPLGLWERPDLFVKGFMVRSPFDAISEPVRIHLYLQLDQDGSIDAACMFQVVRFPDLTVPTDRLRWGRDAPGQYVQP